MRIIFYLIYTVLYTCLLFPLFLFAGLWNKKIRLGIIGRFSQLKKINTFSKQNTHSEIIYFHSASVGEWEQSVPIIQKLKSQKPDIKIVASFFSPSAIKHAQQNLVDLAVYLPFDFPWTCFWFIKKIHPKLFIISKYDVWPWLIKATHFYKAPSILSSAELAADSKRYKGLNAYLNSLFYSYISYILPVSEEYKSRFLHFYAYPDKLFVFGDTRYDRIIEKCESIKDKESEIIFKNPKPITLVFGSIWPADEKHILPAIALLYKKYSNINIVLVPHELHENHIADVESFLKSHQIESERYTNFKSNNGTICSVAIINTIGMLAGLYKNSNIAYVGGAFSTGVHNVAEPAVFANAVVFGPKYINSFEASEFIKKDFAFTIKNEDEAVKIFDKLIDDTIFCEQTGKKSQDFILSNKGASIKTVELINTILK